MKPCRSLIIANKVLEGLMDSEIMEACEYHSFYSGNMDPNGFCGYIIYGKRARNTIKVIFYSTNKYIDIPIRLFILINGKNKVRDLQLNVEDAIKSIIDKVDKFMTK